MKKCFSRSVIIALTVCFLLYIGAGTQTGSASATLYRNDVPYANDDRYPLYIYNTTVYAPYDIFIGLKDIEYKYDLSADSFYYFNTRTGDYITFNLRSNTGVIGNVNTADYASLPIRTVSQHGTIYVPVNYVCEALGTGREINRDQTILRISDGTSPLKLAQVLEREGQTKPSEPDPPPPPPPPIPPAQEEVAPCIVYLTFTVSGANAGNVGKVLEILGREGKTAVFYLTADVMEERPDLARAILISGHRVGYRFAAAGRFEEDRRRSVSLMYGQTLSGTRFASVGFSGDEVPARLRNAGYVCAAADINIARSYTQSAMQRLFTDNRKDGLILNFEMMSSTAASVEAFIAVAKKYPQIDVRALNETNARDMEQR